MSESQTTEVTELVVFSARTRDALVDEIRTICLQEHEEDLAELSTRLAAAPPAPYRVAIVTTTYADLKTKLKRVVELLSSSKNERFNLANAAFFGYAPEGAALPKTAFLFPGYGAQYPNMLGELFARLPVLRAWFDTLDPIQKRRLLNNELLFARQANSESTAPARRRQTTLGDIIDAVFTANLAIHVLLTHLGVPCDAMAGHSYGETTLLVASGMLDDDSRGIDVLRNITRAATNTRSDEAALSKSCAMLAIGKTSRSALPEIWNGEARSVFLALDNCPEQAILCGDPAEITRIEALIQQRQEISFRLPLLTQPVHTPLFPVTHASLLEIYHEIALRPPRAAAYSCSTAAPYPTNIDEIRDILARQWLSPVRFTDTIERLYDDGIRTFLEVGPGGRLTGFVRDILRKRDAIALPVTQGNTSALREVQSCLAQLFVRGYPIDLTKLVFDRAPMSFTRKAPATPAHAAPTAAPAAPTNATKAAPPASSRAAELSLLTPPERKRALVALVMERVVEVLSLTSADLIEPEAGFFELGFGSLASVRLVDLLSESLDLPLPKTAAFDYPSPLRLAEYLDACINPAKPEEQQKTAPRGDIDEPIAIVGMACRFPGDINDPEALWEFLVQGKDAIVDVPHDRWDPEDLYRGGYVPRGEERVRRGGFLSNIDTFDAEFFGISPREALTLDPQQRLLLEVIWEALENAGVNPQGLMGSTTGVFVGLSSLEYAQRFSLQERLAIGGYLATGNTPSTAAGRISYVLGLNGPSMVVDTACSSSLVAVHLACESLRRGESALALAGGVNLMISPELTVYLSLAGAISKDGRCKTFDASADGYGRAEGCGIVVLKRLRDALLCGDRILALVRSSAVNHDGRTSGLTVPSGPSQQAVVRAALANADLRPEDVHYVEAHGTGTSLGDPIEVTALGEVFARENAAKERSAPLFLGSIKTNLGHLEAGAGIAGLMKVALQIQHATLVPSLHFKVPNPKMDWAALPFEVPTRALPWPSTEGPRRAGVSSFGISGTNAHLILEEAPSPLAPSMPAEGPHLLSLSAKSEPALVALASALQRRIGETTLSVRDICFTSNIGRAHFRHRAAFVVETRDELAQALGVYLGSKANEGRPSEAMLRARGGPALAFLFTGQGSVYPQMGRELFHSEPVFRAAIEACAAILDPDGDVALQDILFPSAPQHERLLEQTVYAQPALFSFEYALASLWQSYGIEPDFVMGHSVGEYVAALVAGIFTLEDGLRLIAGRARLMQSLPEGGAMLAVSTSIPWLRDRGALDEPGISVAAVNGPENVVLSGSREAIAAIAHALTGDGVRCTALKVSHAFHSALMDPILGDFRDLASTVSFRRPRIPLISTLTGARIGDEVLSPEYWTLQLRRPVRFESAVEALEALHNEAFLEIGPKPVLIGLGQGAIPNRGQLWLPSIMPPVPERRQILESLGRLYERGLDPRWAGVVKGKHGRTVSLPTYPFQRDRYWLEAKPLGAEPTSSLLLSASQRATPQSGAEKTREAPQRKRLRDALGESSVVEQEELLQTFLSDLVGRILMIPQGRRIDQDLPLHQMGLDSMMALHLRNGIQAEMRMDLPLVSLLDPKQNIARLVRVILDSIHHAEVRDAAGTTARDVEAGANANTTCPLSDGQRALWFLWKLSPESSAYNQSERLWIRDRVDPRVFRDICRALVSRHAMLRTIFPADEEPLQRVLPPGEVDWAEIDATGFNEATLLAAMSAEHTLPFDLEHGPVARFRWFSRAEDDHVLLLTIHHIVCDAWSFGIIFDDLQRRYDAYKTNTPPPFEPLTHSYQDYVRWQREMLAGPQGERLWAYWSEQLAGPLPVLNLPTDRPRPPVFGGRSASSKFTLRETLASALRNLARDEGATVYAVFVAAFLVLLHRYTMQDDILLGTFTAGRDRREFAAIVGYFVDPLVLRARFQPGQTFAELVCTVRQTILSALEHRDMPFARIVERLRPERDPSRSPLFDVTINHLNLRTADDRGLELLDLPDTDSKFDLTLTVIESGSSIIGSLSYNKNLFDPRTIERMERHLLAILESVSTKPSARIQDVPLESTDGPGPVPVLRGRVVTDPRASRPVVRLFEEEAALHPDNIAVKAGGIILTYAELDQKANRVARQLRARGVGPDVVVGFYLGRSVGLLIAIVGILKAGGAYVPIDLTHPQSLITSLLERGGARFLLTERSLQEAIAAQPVPILCLEDLTVDTGEDGLAIDVEPSLSDLVYVLFTSGSTGTPKGVAIENRSLSNYVASILDDLDIAKNSHFALVSTISADLGNTVLFPSLCSGGCLHVLADETAAFGPAFAEYLASNPIDYLKIVPSHLAALVDSGQVVMPRKAVILGGESSPVAWVEALRARSPHCRFFNHYGPTETTVGILTYAFDPAELPLCSPNLPLRKPIAGCDIYLLDEQLRSVPAGVVGELYLGGAGLGRGYINEPERTRKAFVPHPSPHAGVSERLYKTGDLARQLPTSDIEILGRKDRQVKIRGYRVELAQVEAALRSHPSVQQCVVWPDQDGPKATHLIAYVVTHDEAAKQANTLERSLQAFAEQTLPKSMVPQSFVLLDEMPLTSNGKVDPVALRRLPTERKKGTTRRGQPRDLVELDLVRIWSELLGVPRVGVTDDFFALGGHSLLAIRIAGRIYDQFQQRISLATLLSHPTIASLADVIRGGAARKARSLLAPLRRTGEGPPLFLLPGAGGNVLYFSALAQSLRSNRPVYGLQAIGLDTDEPIPSTIEQIAAVYVDAIRREIQPEGPYLLAGHSFGGLVAFEMATQLLALGSEVAFLGVLDNAAPGLVPEAFYAGWDTRQWLEHIAIRISKLYGTPVPLSDFAPDGMTKEEQIGDLIDRFVRAGLMPVGMNKKYFGRFIEVYRANAMAALSYRPSGPPLPLRVTLFRAMDDDPELRRQSGIELTDPTLGWQRYSNVPIRQMDVPGTHISMLMEPHVADLALRLESCI